MLEINWFNYVIGFAYSGVAGWYFMKMFSDNAWESIGELNKKNKDKLFRWTTILVGIIERTLYTSAIWFAAKEFIAIWLAVKVASQWKKWDKNDEKSRAMFNLYLINTALSIAYGTVGGLITLWLNEGKNYYLLTVVVSIFLIALSLVFSLVARKNRKAMKVSRRKRTG